MRRAAQHNPFERQPHIARVKPIELIPIQRYLHLVDVPPKLAPKTNRAAALLNFVLPGAGQLYLGQWLFGSILILLFLICFAGFVGVAGIGIFRYFQIASSGELLAPGQLEQVQHSFHLPWLLGLLAGSLIILVISMVTLNRSPRR